MAYGFEIKNKFGDDILSTQGMLFVRSGYPKSMRYPTATPGNAGYRLPLCDAAGFFGAEQMSRLTAWALSGGNGPNQVSTNQTTGFSWDLNSFGYNGLITQITSTQDTVKNYGGVDVYTPYAEPDTQDGSDFIFFELPSTGLHYFHQLYNPYDFIINSNNKGLMGIAVPVVNIGSGNFLKYIVTTSQKPSVSGTHGLQTLDDSGNVIYDSRYLEQPFRVREVVKITKAQLEDCINNGTTYDFTLRNSFVTPYVGGSLAPAGRVLSGGYAQYPTLTMANSSTLRLSRHQYFGSNSNGQLTTPSIAYDSYIIMTDLGI